VTYLQPPENVLDVSLTVRTVHVTEHTSKSYNKIRRLSACHYNVYATTCILRYNTSVFITRTVKRSRDKYRTSRTLSTIYHITTHEQLCPFSQQQELVHIDNVCRPKLFIQFTVTLTNSMYLKKISISQNVQLIHRLSPVMFHSKIHDVCHRNTH